MMTGMRNVNEIIVHCTATRADWREGQSTTQRVAEVKRWHVDDNGWSDIGYHFLIDRDGTVAPGRPESKTGAHTKGHNTGTIGVSLFGGASSNENDQFADNFTPAQDKALRKLISELEDKYSPKKSIKISGHNEYSAKACPGFNARRWYEGKPPRSIASSSTLQAGTITATVGGVGTVTAAMGGLDPSVQIIMAVGSILIVLSALWIMKERIGKFRRSE